MSTLFGSDPNRSFEDSSLLLAVEVLLQSAQTQYQRMQAAIVAHDSSEAGDPHRSQALNAFLADAVSFISAVDLLRRLVANLPGGGELRVWKESFVRSAQDSEEARHHFAHLDRSIRTAASHGESAFGSPSWITPPDETTGEFSMTFSFPGQVQEGSLSASQKIGRPIDRPVGAIRIRLAGEEYDLSDAHDAVLRLTERLVAFYRPPTDGGIPEGPT